MWKSETADIQSIRNECAKQILTLYKRANAGHIGSALSCLEILVHITFQRMGEKDYLILSKGHAACALYVTLANSGRLPKEALSRLLELDQRISTVIPSSY